MDGSWERRRGLLRRARAQSEASAFGIKRIINDRCMAGRECLLEPAAFCEVKAKLWMADDGWMGIDVRLVFAIDAPHPVILVDGLAPTQLVNPTVATAGPQLSFLSVSVSAAVQTRSPPREKSEKMAPISKTRFRFPRNALRTVGSQGPGPPKRPIRSGQAGVRNREIECLDTTHKRSERTRLTSPFSLLSLTSTTYEALAKSGAAALPSGRIFDCL